MKYRLRRCALTTLRAGGTLFLLDQDGRVIAAPHEHLSGSCCRELPFGLQGLVDETIATSSQTFAEGKGDVTFDFPLVVQIFSLKAGLRSLRHAIALYVQRAYRRSD